MYIVTNIFELEIDENCDCGFACEICGLCCCCMCEFGSLLMRLMGRKYSKINEKAQQVRHLDRNPARHPMNNIYKAPIQKEMKRK